MLGDNSTQAKRLLQRRQRDACAAARDCCSVGVEMDDTGFVAAKTLVAGKAGDHRHGGYQISVEARSGAPARNRHGPRSRIRIRVAALLEWSSGQDWIDQVCNVASSLTAGRWS